MKTVGIMNLGPAGLIQLEQQSASSNLKDTRRASRAYRLAIPTDPPWLYYARYGHGSSCEGCQMNDSGRGTLPAGSSDIPTRKATNPTT